MLTLLRIKPKRLALLTAFFAIGFAAIVAQIVLTREFLVVLSGNELCIGLILASWLLSIGVGAWIGAVLADRIKALVAMFLTGIAALAVALPFQILAIRNAYMLLGVLRGEEIPLLAMLVFCPLVTAPSSLMVGFLFPLAGRLSTEVEDSAAGGVAGLYASESAGSLLGGLLFTFLLVEILSPMQVAMLNALLLAIGWIFIAFTVRILLWRSITAALGVGILICAGYGIADLATKWDRELAQMRWNQKVGIGLERTASTDSRYQQLTVCKHEGTFTLYANGQNAGGYDPLDREPDLLALFMMGQHPKPRNLLLIGTGTEACLPAILSQPVDRVDYILLDDKVLRLLQPFLPKHHLEALEDSRLHLHIGDGRRFLQTTSRSFDMIIVMVPPPSTAMLNRYYTFDFFKIAHEHLHSDSILILPITMPPNYLSGIAGKFGASVSQALSELFPETIYTYDAGDMVFCGKNKGIISSDFDELKRRWISRGIHDAYVEYFKSRWLQPDRLAGRKAEIEALPAAGRNTDLQPTAYLYRLLVWNRTTGEERELSDTINEAITALREISIWPLLAAIALFTAVSLGIRQLVHKPPQRFTSLVVIATTGFSAMALEILLIFAYQNLFGYVYHEIGLIISMFMAGLAIGAWVIRRWGVRAGTRTRTLLLTTEAGVLILCLAFPILILLGGPALSGNPGGRFILIAVLTIAGFLTGAQFPLAFSLYSKGREKEVGAGAGAVDAADHLGAAGGAALTGVICMPIFGFWLTALVLVCLKAASAIILLRN